MAATEASLPPLSERIFFVTGATDGIGEFTSEQLARQGCTVIVHGRDPAKVDRVVQALKQHTPNIHGFVADLSSLNEVRRLGAEVSAQFPVIHGLLNNAGTFAGNYTGRRQVTVDGNEYSLAVNVLAPFVLTSLLFENVRASGAGRILITSSISAGSNDALSDLQCERRWSDHRAYELSKLCDAMIISELNARYADPPRLCFHTMDPGTVNTKMLKAGWGPCGIPVRSATTSFKMLTEDRYQESSGSGQNYCRGEDAASRARLWQQLEQLSGARYPE
jgi:NAD(P)-dependent dehydrogenase (short-subunit alcohol dehydrogenase family)